MIAPDSNAIDRQQAYYSDTASAYDSWHLDRDIEHNIAAQFLFGMIDHFDFSSLLDVGAGTGRILRMAAAKNPHIRRHGIEPVEAMRKVAYNNGVLPSELTAGDACSIGFEDKSFDIVSAFGVLHHVASPDKAIGEMLRVAKRAIFISDMNCYGFGSWLSRTSKQLLRALKLWTITDFLLTRGRGYRWDEGDGLWYAYSIFDSLRTIQHACSEIYLLKTKGQGTDLYRSCSHVALLAIKNEGATPARPNESDGAGERPSS
jgi:ubiquinone/menaquinone biosynthesis C-methylase UbiE